MTQKEYNNSPPPSKKKNKQNVLSNTRDSRGLVKVSRDKWDETGRLLISWRSEKTGEIYRNSYYVNVFV